MCGFEEIDFLGKGLQDEVDECTVKDRQMRTTRKTAGGQKQERMGGRKVDLIEREREMRDGEDREERPENGMRVTMVLWVGRVI